MKNSGNPLLAYSAEIINNKGKSSTLLKDASSSSVNESVSRCSELTAMMLERRRVALVAEIIFTKKEPLQEEETIHCRCSRAFVQ